MKIFSEPTDDILHITHAKLSKIPYYDHKIRILNLSRNLIEYIDLMYSETLLHIDLSDNKISKMENFELVPKLRTLDLSYNIIKKINIKLSSLTELYLIGNFIESIEGLSLLNLSILDIAGNKLTKIKGFENCVTITQLYLGCNQIKEISDLNYLTDLRILDVQSNLLTVVDCNLLPPSIEHLLLGDNKNLTQIFNLDRLVNLKTLGVERTKIEKLNTTIDVWYK